MKIGLSSHQRACKNWPSIFPEFSSARNKASSSSSSYQRKTSLNVWDRLKKMNRYLLTLYYLKRFGPLHDITWLLYNAMCPTRYWDFYETDILTFTKLKVKFKSRDSLKTLLSMINAMAMYHFNAGTWNYTLIKNGTFYIIFKSNIPYFFFSPYIPHGIT